MKIERSITFYNKDNEKMFKEIDITYLDISVLNKIFTPLEDDSHLYRPYDIDKTQYYNLIKHVKELEDYNYDEFYYVLETYSL